MLFHRYLIIKAIDIYSEKLVVFTDSLNLPLDRDRAIHGDQTKIFILIREKTPIIFFDLMG